MGRLRTGEEIAVSRGLNLRDTGHRIDELEAIGLDPFVRCCGCGDMMVVFVAFIDTVTKQCWCDGCSDDDRKHWADDCPNRKEQKE